MCFSLSGRWPRRRCAPAAASTLELLTLTCITSGSDGSGGAEWEMEKVLATQVLFADKCVFQLVREIQGFS